MHIKSLKREYWLVPVLALSAFVVMLVPAAFRTRRAEPAMEPPVTVGPEAVDPWKRAALKVEEDRGEPVGRKADISIPSQLKHYSERQRFLAVQVAEWREQGLETPHDYADLVELIRRGELVEVPPLGRGFILYGVGWGADDGPFTHYDGDSGQRVTLYGDDAALQQEYARLDGVLELIGGEAAELRKEFDKTPARERSRRAELRKQEAEKEKALAQVRKEKALLDSFYRKEKRREMLAAESEAVAGLARDFGGRAYDLGDAAARKNFKMRLLSFLRPQALGLLEEVARPYEQKFERPLPVTSLVRTNEYQDQLGETNANATQIDVPPHTTGLAFDVFYGRMAADEQEYVMAELARLKDEGRIEVLRENRDHYHVFVFADGRPPGESLVLESLGKKEAGSVKKEATAVKKAADKPAAKKADARKTQEAKKKPEPKKRGEPKRAEKAKRPAEKTTRAAPAKSTAAARKRRK